MSKRLLPASVLAATITAGVALAPVQAGHAMYDAHGQMPHAMAHHGAMGHPQRQDNTARLGVAIADVAQSDLDRRSLEYAVRVEKVLKGSAAEAAGIQRGDLVTAINDRPVYSPERLQHLVSQARGVATVRVVRDGNSLTVEAMFAEPKAGNAQLGVRIQEMTDELKEVFGSQGDAGVLVSQVIAGSAAKQAGLKAGDVIVSLGKDQVGSVRDVTTALARYAPGDKIDVAFVREREQRSIQVELDGSDSGPNRSHAKHPHWMLGHQQWGHGHYGHHGMMPKKGCWTGKKHLRS